MTKRHIQSASSELPGGESPDVGKAVSEFVRDHPLIVVAGGIAMGAIVAAMLPRGTSRKLARRAIGLAEAASAASMLLGSRARDGAEAAGASLRKQGGVVADRLERLGETASERMGHLGDTASSRIERLIDPVENVATKVARKAAELRSRARH